MAKKKLTQKQIATVAILIIVAIVLLSYLSYTGYASVFRQTMGDPSGVSRPSGLDIRPMQAPAETLRASCTESCVSKTVTLYTRQQATFCCDVVELKSVSNDGAVVVTVTDGYKSSRDYSAYCSHFVDCPDDTITLVKAMPTCSESITDEKKVLDVNIEIISTSYSDTAHESRATLKLSRS